MRPANTISLNPVQTADGGFQTREAYLGLKGGEREPNASHVCGHRGSPQPQTKGRFDDLNAYSLVIKIYEAPHQISFLHSSRELAQPCLDESTSSPQNVPVNRLLFFHNWNIRFRFPFSRQKWNIIRSLCLTRTREKQERVFFPLWALRHPCQGWTIPASAGGTLPETGYKGCHWCEGE